MLYDLYFYVTRWVPRQGISQIQVLATVDFYRLILYKLILQVNLQCCQNYVRAFLFIVVRLVPVQSKSRVELQMGK